MSNIFSEILSDSIRLNNMTDKKSHKKFISTFLSQNGGSFSKKSVNTDDEVNQLISMLTSDSEDKSSFNTNSTQTEALENKLRNMTQNGGATPDAVKVKEACNLLKNAGYTFSVKGQNCNDFIMSNTSSNFMDQISSIFTKKEEPHNTETSSITSLFLPIRSSGNTEKKSKINTTTSSAVAKPVALTPTSSEIPEQKIIKKGDQSLLDVAADYASGLVKNLTNTVGLTQESGKTSSPGTTSSSTNKLLTNPSTTSERPLVSAEQLLKGGGKKNKKSKKVSKKNGSRKNRK
jgi:hypothetical protein